MCFFCHSSLFDTLTTKIKICQKVVFTRFQGVCYARKRGRHGRGYNHRWCLRENNLFNGGGYHHAPIGLLVGGTNFSELRWELEPARVVNGVERAAVTINYGNFIQTMLDFVIIAFAIFLFIRLLSNLRRKKEEAPLPPPAPSNEEKLLSEIRDLIKKQ